MKWILKKYFKDIKRNKSLLTKHYLGISSSLCSNGLFDEEEIYASLAIQIAKIRQEEKLTQQELAKRLHTTQQTVSRLENVHNESYSLGTLIKLARALDKRLKVELV